MPTVTDRRALIPDDWYSRTSMDNAIGLIRENYVAPWLRCNMWHVQGRDRDLLIDTGMGLRPLKPEIQDQRDRPLLVISTHCHFDHIGGAHEFDCRLGHRLEADVHADPEIENGDGYGAFVQAETFQALPWEGFSHEQFRVTPAPLTGYLDEGDVLDLGDRVFQVLHVPGHSAGSIALFEAATGTLFSGDLLYDGALLDDLPTSNIDHYTASLERLRSLPIETVHGGHFDSFNHARMLELIDSFMAGEASMGDQFAWVSEQIRRLAQS